MCAAPLNAYQDPRSTGALREDLSDLIVNISPTDTPFLSGLKKGQPAGSVYVEWMYDTLPTRDGGTARAEGATVSFTALTNLPTRAANYTIILDRDYQVSATMAACDYAGQNPLSREMKKATLALANDMEYQLINGSAAYIGTDNSAARTMLGAVGAISTCAFAAGNVPLDVKMMDDVCALAWIQGGKPREIYVHQWLKRKISSFNVGLTRNVQAADKRLINDVMVYENAFATQYVILSRDMRSSADDATLMMIDPDLWDIAYLRPPHTEQLAKTRDVADNGMVITEFTLRYRAQQGNAKITGLSTTA